MIAEITTGGIVLKLLSLFLKRGYKQCVHLYYMHVDLRFKTYKYLPPLLTLRSHFIVNDIY